jgi:serine/threonine protein phosphatase PrpC
VPAVSKCLALECGQRPDVTSTDILSSISRAFVALDDNLLQGAKHDVSWSSALSPQAVDNVTRVFSGSCALLAIFDPKTSLLRVACTGDSRAVLGRWDPVEEKYVTIPLSVDQTGFNQSEVERITKEHPGEDDIIDPKTGRLLGMAVTRAFGDHRWKWADDVVKAAQYKFFGYPPRPNSKTPPYMTAEPVITETEIRRGDNPPVDDGKADFLILASDGLWDRMSSECAVEIVEKWLEAKKRGNGRVSPEPRQYYQSHPLHGPDSGAKYDVEEGKYPTWKVEAKYYAIEDENAAGCLARNLFGGTRRELVNSVLAYEAPLSRYVRDDTTIVVVFFDRPSESGKEKEK